MHGVSAHTGFPRTLTKTIYISAIFSTLNPILSVANLSRLECAETQFARKPRAYEYLTVRAHPVDASGGDFAEVGGNLSSSGCLLSYSFTDRDGGLSMFIFSFSFSCMRVVENSEVFFNQKRTKGSSKDFKGTNICTASFHTCTPNFTT